MGDGMDDRGETIIPKLVKDISDFADGKEQGHVVNRNMCVRISEEVIRTLGENRNR